MIGTSGSDALRIVDRGDRRLLFEVDRLTDDPKEWTRVCGSETKAVLDMNDGGSEELLIVRYEGGLGIWG